MKFKFSPVSYVLFNLISFQLHTTQQVSTLSLPLLHSKEAKERMLSSPFTEPPVSGAGELGTAGALLPGWKIGVSTLEDALAAC